MLRRLITLLCCTLCLASAGAAEAPAKPYKIMMILYRGATEAEKGFMDYFNRRHIAVELTVRDAQADNSKIADFVAEARALKPDLIYTFGTTVTAAVAGLEGQVDPVRHITDIPVVFNIVADPVGAGLVRSLAGSGRNLTGASHMVPLRAQLQALEAMHSTRTLGVIYNSQEKNSTLAVQQLQALAPEFHLTLELAPVGNDSSGRPQLADIRSAMHGLVQKRPQFIYLPSDSLLIKNADVVLQAAQAASIPVFAATEAPIRNDGALLGLVSTYYNVGELAAHKAEQILSKRVPAGRIPVESLNRFTYLVNMGTAKKLKLYPPLSVVKFAELIVPLDSVDARE